MKNFLNIIAIVCLIISICLFVAFAIFYERLFYPDWIICLPGIGLIASCIFIIAAHNKKTDLTNRLKKIQKEYPNAFRKYMIPTTLNKVNREIAQLLNRDFSVWEKEEQEIIRQQHNARLAEKERVEKLKATIKKNLEIFTQAIREGNIELADEKVLALDNSSIVDEELAETIDIIKKEYKKKYNEGIPDPFKESYVNYGVSPYFVQGENWAYAVAKFPSKGTIVFPYRRRNIARIGHMEKPFQKYLKEKLSGSKLLIFGDCAILPADNNRPYEPDIAIVDSENPSIRIDIEVDEPYAAITNKPIHYIGGGDEFRDINLNNLGWIVVRFTEYQVYSDMLGCTSFIAQLIYSLNPLKSIPEFLLKQKFPETQKRWTKNEAMVMASEKARQKYLKYEFRAFDNDEQLKIEDIKQTETEKFYTTLVKPLKVASPSRTEKNIGNALSIFERDNYIQFLPQEHIYIYNGRERFTPVSSVISCFFKPFDSFSQSARKAIERHISQGQVLEEWDEKGACSREVGTFMHRQIENYYNGGTYQTEYTFKYDGKFIQSDKKIDLNNEYKQFEKFVKDHTIEPYRTEWAIYDERLKIAGTIDMIHKNGNVFDIYDWKRSHKVVDDNGHPIIRNDYDKFGSGKLGHIDDTSYWHYCIQQNIYRYILEKNYNVKVGKMYLVVFRDNADRYIKLEVPSMNKEIEAIVEACKKGEIENMILT